MKPGPGRAAPQAGINMTGPSWMAGTFAAVAAAPPGGASISSFLRKVFRLRGEQRFSIPAGESRLTPTKKGQFLS